MDKEKIIKDLEKRYYLYLIQQAKRRREIFSKEWQEKNKGKKIKFPKYGES